MQRCACEREKCRLHVSVSPKWYPVPRFFGFGFFKCHVSTRNTDDHIKHLYLVPVPGVVVARESAERSKTPIRRSVTRATSPVS